VPKPVASVVVPTRDRADYLAVTLASLADQSFREPYEVIVVDDGSSDATTEVIARSGVRAIVHDRPRGPNAARNAGTRAAQADLIALVDDDVFAPRGWLEALVAGTRRHDEADVVGGPIRASLEGPAPRSCGREAPPVTTLDLGPADRETQFVWSANMMFRRSAFERIGPFDEERPPGGDEEEWLRRLADAGGRVFYVAGATIDHRRAGDDVRLRALMRSAYRRGRSLRAYDESRGDAPALARELRVFAGCGWHVVRRACPQGLIMGAHSAGRLMQAVGR
jgi:GT2 family glycosyltransferase